MAEIEGRAAKAPQESAPASDLPETDNLGATVSLVPDVILGPGNEAGAEAEESVYLDLTDLLPDESGEVVLFAGEDLPVNILASEPVTETGIAEAHVTASGLDVTGLHFYSFESGITVYSPSDLLILISPESV